MRNIYIYTMNIKEARRSKSTDDKTKYGKVQEILLQLNWLDTY